jgi:hypothetical protein
VFHVHSVLKNHEAVEVQGSDSLGDMLLSDDAASAFLVGEVHDMRLLELEGGFGGGHRESRGIKRMEAGKIGEKVTILVFGRVVFGRSKIIGVSVVKMILKTD